MDKLTDKQLERLYRKVWRRIERAFDGGMTFGVDMPTLWIIAPDLASAVVRIRVEASKRWKQVKGGK